jgi:hypothetical protein
MQQVVVTVVEVPTDANGLPVLGAAGLLEDLEGTELLAAIDTDIAKFDECFQQELGNEPLVRSELAILKTYLFWKTHSEKFNATQEGSAVPV